MRAEGAGGRFNRRGFVAGGLAGAAAPLLVRPSASEAAVTFAAEGVIVRRGRAIAAGPRAGRGRILVVAHERRRTIAITTARGGRARLVDVGGQPLELAISPDGRLAAVTTAFWDEPALAIVDLAGAKLRERIEVGPAPFGVTFTPDGGRLLVSGGEQEGTLHILDAESLRVRDVARVGLVPRGIAVAPGAGAAWVALNGDDRIVRVDLRKGRAERTIKTVPLPDRIALDAAGKRLIVSHGGRDAEHLSEIRLESGRLKRHRAGRLPSAVGWTRDGRPLATVGGAGRIVVFGHAGGRTVRRVDGFPRGLAIAGGRAWVVDGITGEIRSIRL